MTTQFNKNQQLDNIFNGILEGMKEVKAKGLKLTLLSPSPAKNARTGTELKGVSQLYASILMQSKNYKENLWVTYNQAAELVGYSKKDGKLIWEGDSKAPKFLAGEKGVRFIFSRPPLFKSEERGRFFSYEKLSGKEQIKADKGELETLWKQGSAVYFNIEQIRAEIIKPIKGRTEKPFVINDKNKDFKLINPKIEDFISKAMKNMEINKLPYSSSEGAYYVPSKHGIHMPKINQFEDSQTYYSTFFHELGHATGHSSLLSRESLQGHGDERVYAYEEFVAEFTASILSQQFGLDTTVSHAEYLNIYIKAIEDEPRKILIDAFNEAKAAVKLMTDFVEKPVSTRIERQLLVS